MSWFQSYPMTKKETSETTTRSQMFFSLCQELEEAELKHHHRSETNGVAERAENTSRPPTHAKSTQWCSVCDLCFCLTKNECALLLGSRASRRLNAGPQTPARQFTTPQRCAYFDVTYRARGNPFQINSREPENRIRIMELIEKRVRILNFRRKNAN